MSASGKAIRLQSNVTTHASSRLLRSWPTKRWFWRTLAIQCAVGGLEARRGGGGIWGGRIHGGILTAGDGEFMPDSRGRIYLQFANTVTASGACKEALVTAWLLRAWRLSFE